MDDVAVIIIGALLIIFTVWWFFGKHAQSQASATMAKDTQEAKVVVDGGYTPNVITLKQGVPATITFIRKDSSNCFSHVVFPDFGIHEELPTEGNHAIPIDTSKAGEYEYACGMNMFHGKVVIQ